jgi:hypothetical protein
MGARVARGDPRRGIRAQDQGLPARMRAARDAGVERPVLLDRTAAQLLEAGDLDRPGAEGGDEPAREARLRIMRHVRRGRHRQPQNSSPSSSSVRARTIL